MCVIIFRDPIANAVSLTDNAKKSAQGNETLPMTVERWLNAWEEGASGMRFQRVHALHLRTFLNSWQ